MAQRGGKREGAGRKKGEATLYSEALKAKIAELVEKDAREMIMAQIKKAKKGDTLAFKELMDRTLGKPTQPIAGDKETPLTFQITGMQIIKDGTDIQN